MGASQSPNRGLMTVTYDDMQKSIYLRNYADAVVYDAANGRNTLCAIRFGGYPEQVNGMAQAIYGGGDVTAEIDGRNVTLKTLAKGYRRKISHDGIYAEALLTAEDETQSAAANENENTEAADAAANEIRKPGTDTPPRNSFVYTAPGDRDALYGAIDRKTSVPMIPEFADYIIDELRRTGALRPLVVASASLKIDAWALRCSGGDRNIVEAVESGIRSGAIAIPGAKSGCADAFADVGTVTDYLGAYGANVAERIKCLFTPLFDPESDALSPEIVAINDAIREKAGYSLYDAQLAVAESIKRQLERGKAGLIIAECGAGKTKIGAAAVAASVAGLRANQDSKNNQGNPSSQGSPNSQGKTKTFNIVLCPSHVKEKWVREIEETLPDTFARIVNSITELDSLYNIFAKGGKHCYAVISKEMARDGYMHMPAATWSKSRRAFTCPDCRATVRMPISNSGSRYYVNADQHFFRKQNRDNRKCAKCGSTLWAALNPTAKMKPEWRKLSGYGFVYQPKAADLLRKETAAAFAEKIRSLIDAPGGVPAAVGAHRKYPLSTYIKKRYKGRIDGLIVDELQQYNNDSGQGDAMAELFGVARKAVGMTGTLVNGYASGIFHLLFRLMPRLMLEDGKSHSAPGDFVAEYGVVESTYEVKEGDYNDNRRSVRTKKSSRQLPGVSPLVYSKFLLEHAAFLSLSDMGKDMPEYEEIPVPLKMPIDVAREYYRVQDALIAFMREDAKTAKRILSAYLNLLTAYPDQPYGQPAIVNPADGTPIVEPLDTADFDAMLPKDRATLDIVKRKAEAGERVLIYTNWTRLDTQRKLAKMLTEAGYRTETLPATVKPEKRERWVADCVARGTQALITNPALVETGLDLIPFTTLIFYDTGYKLFTLRQASRRSWRINQEHPRIEVYMPYYVNTMQHKAMTLMAKKLAVAGIIEGGFSEEGLAAMSQCDDMASQMAKELMLGIKDSVEDVSAAFKRMSATKRREPPPDAPVFTDIPVEVKPSRNAAHMLPEFTFMPTPTPITPVTTNRTASAASAGILTLAPTRSGKTIAPDERQFSLFDMTA